MDDSWRMLIGMTDGRKSKKNLPRRRSTEDTSAFPQQSAGIFLGPEDFSDVFGGPPRTVLARQFSATSSNVAYEEIFKPPRLSRERSEGFYGDIFTKTGSNASSVLSSEEQMTPGDSNCSYSVFASKLRPINIPNRWTSSATLTEEQQWQQGPEFSTNDSSYLDSLFTESNFVDNFKNSLHGLSRRCSSPETDNLKHDPYDMAIYEQEDENNNEVISSYTSEIDRDNTVSIDEAVNWAKKTFYSGDIWSKYPEN